MLSIGQSQSEFFRPAGENARSPVLCDRLICLLGKPAAGRAYFGHCAATNASPCVMFVLGVICGVEYRQVAATTGDIAVSLFRAFVRSVPESESRPIIELFRPCALI